MERSASKDEALFAAYRDGADEGALSALLSRHWQPSYRLAFALVRDPGAAEDVAQDAFVQVVHAARKRRELDPFAPWLRTVVLNGARNALRSRKRRGKHETSAGVDSMASIAKANEDPSEAVREHARSLPEKLGLPILLHFGFGLTHDEVAEAIGCPRGTASTRIREGIERLRQSLAATGMAVSESALLALLPQTLVEKATVPPSPSPAALAARARASARRLGPKVAAALAVVAVAALTSLAGLLLLPEGERARGPGPNVHAIAQADSETDARASVAPKATLSPSGGATEPEKALASLPDTKNASPAPQGGAAAASLPVDKVKTRDGWLRQVRGQVVDAAGLPVGGVLVRVSARVPRDELAQGVAPRQDGDLLAEALDRRAEAVCSQPDRTRIELGSAETSADGLFTIATQSSEAKVVWNLALCVRTANGSATALATIGSAGANPGMYVTHDLETDDEVFDFGKIVLQQTTRVTLQIRSGGLPVPDARVRVDAEVREQHHGEFIQGWTKYTLVSDREGKVRMELSSPQNLCLLVEKPGFALEYVTPDLVAREKVRFPLKLANAPGDELGFVLELRPESPVRGSVHEASGRPVAGARVQARIPTEDESFSIPLGQLVATTDAQGEFTLHGLAADRRYELEVDAKDEALSSISESLTPPVPGVLNLVLEAPGSVTGHVLDAAGEDRGFALQRQDQNGEWRDVSYRMDGATARGVRPGTYRLVAIENTIEMASPPLRVEPGKESKATIQLPAPRNMSGTVVDGSRLPVAEANVRVRLHMPITKRTFSLAYGTAEDGKFRFRDLPDGDLVFTIAKPGFKRATAKLAAGSTDLGEVVLVPGELEPDPEGDD